MESSDNIKPRPRRYMIAYLAPVEILSIFRIGAGSPVALKVPILCGDIPADVELIAVHFDYYRDAFAFKLWSSAWPEVMEGQLIPALVGVTIGEIGLGMAEIEYIRQQIPRRVNH